MLLSGKRAFLFTDIFKEGLRWITLKGSFCLKHADDDAATIKRIRNSMVAFIFIVGLLLLQVYFVNCR